MDEGCSKRHASAALPPGMNWYALCRRLEMFEGRSGRVREISTPTGIRSLKRSESLYRLSYPGPHTNIIIIIIIIGKVHPRTGHDCPEREL
jgi:hypothetical protein